MRFRVCFRRRPAAVAILLACLAVVANVARAEIRTDVEIPSLTNGQPLKGTLFVPDTAGPEPAVIVLPPGRGWPEPADERFARDLARNGYVALTVGYQVNGAATGRASWSPRITSDLVGTVNWLRARPEVGNRPVGVVGFSAGSHGILLGARHGGVAAVVVYYGGYNLRKFVKAAARLPATVPLPIDKAADVKGAILLLHGDEDDEVPVQDAVEMRDALKAAGKTVELVVYPGATHRFERGNVGGRQDDIGPTGFTYREDPAAARDAFRRTLAWFGKYLAPVPAAGSAPDGDAEPVGPTGRTPSQVVAGSDRDGDGRVSRAEFRGPPANFDGIDADGDGFLTRAELTAAYRKRR